MMLQQAPILKAIDLYHSALVTSLCYDSARFPANIKRRIHIPTFPGDLVSVKITLKAAALILISTVAAAQTAPMKPKSTTPAKPAQNLTKPASTPGTPAQTASKESPAVPAVAATDVVITI